LFCPRDSCSKNFDFLLRSAKDSIHCALFDLNLEEIIGTLVDKSNEVDVKIVLDDRSYKDQIKGATKLLTDQSRSHILKSKVFKSNF